MAYLFSHRQWAQFQREDAEHDNRYVWGDTFNFLNQTLFGWPYYIGGWNPDPYPLFLPEPTVRSMCGLWTGGQ